jgi:magnesium transporter
MTESSATRIALTTFQRASLRRVAGTVVDEILAEVDRDAATFIHVVHGGAATSRRILEHFGLPPALAEQIGGPIAFELDTSADGYLLKKFRFIEAATRAAALAPVVPKAGALIRGAETDRFFEGGGALIVGDNFVLLFEEGSGSPLLARAVESALERERDLRTRGLEYLLYRIGKTVFVDNYFALMRQLLERLQELEAPLLEGSTKTGIYRELARLRREMNPFERSLVHVAEFAAEIAAEQPAVQGGFRYWAASLGADSARLEKEFSMLRDRTSELIGTYRDNVNAQLNNIMRSLTVISAIFMPLSFITSFYGMNFVNMPAFTWRGGFPIAIALMLVIAVASLTYARRKKWL